MSKNMLIEIELSDKDMAIVNKAISELHQISHDSYSSDYCGDLPVTPLQQMPVESTAITWDSAAEIARQEAAKQSKILTLLDVMEEDIDDVVESIETGLCYNCEHTEEAVSEMLRNHWELTEQRRSEASLKLAAMGGR